MSRQILLIFLLTISTIGITYAQDYASDFSLIMTQHTTTVATKTKTRFIHYTPPYWIYKFGDRLIKPQAGISERYEMNLRQFAKLSFKEFGPIKGYFMSIDRINRTGRLGYIDFPSIRMNPQRSIIDSPQQYRMK